MANDRAANETWHTLIELALSRNSGSLRQYCLVLCIEVRCRGLTPATPWLPGGFGWKDTAQ